MNKDQLKGRAAQAKGKIKEAASEVVGNPRLQAEGKADEMKGRAQAAAGDAKEKAKRAGHKA